jgi:hypothetical protein
MHIGVGLIPSTRRGRIMPNVTSLFHRAGQTLGRHLDRLRCTFDELRDRVRDAAVQAIGQSVAGAVRDSIRAFLEGVASRPAEVPVSSWSRSPPYWQQHDGLFNDQREPDDYRSDPQHRDWYDHDDELDDEPPPRPTQTVPTEEPRPSRWRQAFAIGCSAAAWHLRRQADRISAVTTFGIGLASAMTAYVCGPALIASALGLFTITESMRAAGALSLFGSS